MDGKVYVGLGLIVIGIEWSLRKREVKVYVEFELFKKMDVGERIGRFRVGC